MRIERVEEPFSLKDELVKFVFGVYQSTNGAYPAIEWVKNKPPDDPGGFRKVYEPRGMRVPIIGPLSICSHIA